jgi:cyclic lactone autoinducer peptide
MKKLVSVWARFAGLLASAALVVGVASSQAACVAWFHQPEVPSDMEKYRK